MGPKFELVKSIDVAGSPSHSSWDPWHHLSKVKLLEGHSLFDEYLGLHLLTRMVLPGDRRPIPIDPKEVEASIQKHLRCVIYESLSSIIYQVIV